MVAFSLVCQHPVEYASEVSSRGLEADLVQFDRTLEDVNTCLVCVPTS